MKKVVLSLFLLCVLAYSIKAQEIDENYFEIPKTKKLEKASSHEEKGDIYYDQGEYNKAIEAYTAALSRSSNNTEAIYYKRGHVYLMLVNYNKAIDDYKSAILINNKYSFAYKSLGYAYYLNGEYKEGVEALKKGVDMGYSHTYTQILGYCYFGINEYEKAYKSMYNATNNRSKILDNTYLFLGFAGYYTKRYSEAIKYLDQYIKKLGLEYNCDIEYIKGKCYLAESKQAKARKCFQRTLELCENGVYAVFCNYYLGNKTKSFTLMHERLENAIKNKEKIEEEYYNITCLYSLDMKEYQALKYLELALQNGLDNINWIETDHDLDNIRGLNEYKRLIAEYKK